MKRLKESTNLTTQDSFFINLDKNDNFSYLKGIDLQELLVQVENSYIPYRDTLNLPKNLSFGIELEYEGIKRNLVSKYIDKKLQLSNWCSKKDDSLILGGEISSPKLYDEISCWKELQAICKYLKTKRVDTCNRAGGHIHIGAHILGKNVDDWKKFLKLYTAYESIIFRFVYGDKISRRRGMFDYAHPVADDLYDIIRVLESEEEICDMRYLKSLLPTREKYLALNFTNTSFGDISNTDKKNTLEFRSPNATVEEVIWQNNINALTKLVLAPSKGLVDEEFLDYKLKHERISSDYDFCIYNEISLKNVLEFVDFIFDNNLDKVYFLRQYLKGFQENYGIKYAVKAKNFVNKTRDK